MKRIVMQGKRGRRRKMEKNVLEKEMEDRDKQEDEGVRRKENKMGEDGETQTIKDEVDTA